MNAAKRRGERFAQLVEELGTKLGRKRGWKQQVAAQLGVHPSYISKIIRGDHGSVSEEVVATAARRLNLIPAFFTAPDAKHHDEFRWPDQPPSVGSIDVLPRSSTGLDYAELLKRAAPFAYGNADKLSPAEAREWAAYAGRWAHYVGEFALFVDNCATGAIRAPDEEVVRAVQYLAWSLLSGTERSPAFPAPPKRKRRGRSKF